MLNCWGPISGPCKGLLLVIIGVILLLHTLGILKEGMGIIITIISLAMIAYGLMLSGGLQYIQKLIRRKKSQ